MTPLNADRAIAALIALGGLGELLAKDDPRGGFLANAVVILALGALFLVRRRHPIVLAGVVLATLAASTQFLISVDEMAWPFLPLLVAAFSVGAHAGARGSWAGLLLCICAIQAVNVLTGAKVTGDYLFPAAFATLAWIAGRAVRSRGVLAAELHEAALRAEEAHERAEADAVADERRRIARELHDVVAHSMSVMVVQAGGARRILDRDPARAEAAAAQIERTGREALSEMRRLLGVMRPGDEGTRAPQPGMDGLDALVERARGAGLPVELDVAGDRVALPPGLDLAAYRIVQESLTNALKHAGGGATRVRVDYRDGELVLLVENAIQDGVALAPDATGGHGLIGMRERVRLFGGELDAGPRGDGAFRVHATLPTST